MIRTRVPLAALLLALALAGVAWWQGLRAGALRQSSLEPARAERGSRAPGDSAWTVSAGIRFAWIELPEPAPERVALYQWMPSRTLVRWVEPAGAATSGHRGRVLVVPLEGLAPGEYAVCAVDASTSAGPREMDLPAEQLRVLDRLRVVEAERR